MHLSRRLATAAAVSSLMLITAGPAAASINVDTDNSGPYCTITYSGKERAATAYSTVVFQGNDLNNILGQYLDEHIQSNAKGTLKKAANAQFLNMMAEYPKDNVNDAYEAANLDPDTVADAEDAFNGDTKAYLSLDNMNLWNAKPSAILIAYYKLLRINEEGPIEYGEDQLTVKRVTFTTGSVLKGRYHSLMPAFVSDISDRDVNALATRFKEAKDFRQTSNYRLSRAGDVEKDTDELRDYLKSVKKELNKDGRDDLADTFVTMFQSVADRMEAVGKAANKISAKELRKMNVENAEAFAKCRKYLNAKAKDDNLTKPGPIHSGGFLSKLMDIIWWIIGLGVLALLFIVIQIGALRRFGIKPLSLRGKAAKVSDAMTDRVPDDMREKMTTGISDFADKASSAASKAAHGASGVFDKAKNKIDEHRHSAPTDQQPPAYGYPPAPQPGQGYPPAPQPGQGYPPAPQPGQQAPAGPTNASIPEQAVPTTDHSSDTAVAEPTGPRADSPFPSARHTDTSTHQGHGDTDTTTPATAAAESEHATENANTAPAEPVAPQESPAAAEKSAHDTQSVAQKDTAAPATHAPAAAPVQPSTPGIPSGFHANAAGTIVPSFYVGPDGQMYPTPEGYTVSLNGMLVPAVYLAQDGQCYAIPAGYTLDAHGMLVADPRLPRP